MWQGSRTSNEVIANLIPDASRLVHALHIPAPSRVDSVLNFQHQFFSLVNNPLQNRYFQKKICYTPNSQIIAFDNVRTHIVKF